MTFTSSGLTPFDIATVSLLLIISLARTLIVDHDCIILSQHQSRSYPDTVTHCPRSIVPTSQTADSPLFLGGLGTIAITTGSTRCVQLPKFRTSTRRLGADVRRSRSRVATERLHSARSSKVSVEFRASGFSGLLSLFPLHVVQAAHMTARRSPVGPLYSTTGRWERRSQAHCSTSSFA